MKTLKPDRSTLQTLFDSGNSERPDLQRVSPRCLFLNRSSFFSSLYKDNDNKTKKGAEIRTQVRSF